MQNVPLQGKRYLRFAWYENVEIMLSGIQMWRFAQICDHFGVRLSISSPLTRPCVSFHYDSLVSVAFGFASTKNIRAIVDEYHGLDELQTCTPFFRGRKLGVRKSGVATVDIVQSRLSVNTSSSCASETLVLPPSHLCYFVAIGTHNLRPVWWYQ